MNGSVALAIFVLIFPFIAALLMIKFMIGGKGKPAPTQDEIVAAKKRKQAKEDKA